MIAKKYLENESKINIESNEYSIVKAYPRRNQKLYHFHAKRCRALYQDHTKRPLILNFQLVYLLSLLHIAEMKGGRQKLTLLQYDHAYCNNLFSQAWRKGMGDEKRAGCAKKEED